MELTTILNRCHRFRGFVYQHARFIDDKKSIEVAVRPRKGSAAVCSRCHLPAPGYDQLAERRFEFIPLWGFSSSFCTPCGALTVAAVVLWPSKKLGRIPPQRSNGDRTSQNILSALSHSVQTTSQSKPAPPILKPPTPPATL